LYANLALFGLLALAAFINGFLEVRERRRGGKRDDSSP
jgi:hypothetical protein